MAPLSPLLGALRPHLASHSSLQHPDLRHNGVGAEDVAALGPHLARLTSLQQIDLDSNDVGAMGTAAMVPHLAAAPKSAWQQSLSQQTDLNTLSLSCMCISLMRDSAASFLLHSHRRLKHHETSVNQEVVLSSEFCHPREVPKGRGLNLLQLTATAD